MKKHLLQKMLTLLTVVILWSMQASAQDNVVYDFATDTDSEGWYGSGTTLSVSGGQMTVTINDNTGYPGIKLDGLSLDESVFTEFEITFTNTTPVNIFQLFRWDGTNKSSAKTEFTTVGTIQETIKVAIPAGDAAGPVPGFFLRLKQGNTASTPGSLVIEQIRVISLNDSGISYDLTTSSTGYGSIIPASGSFPENSVQAITAVPALGYEFTSWGGDLSGSTNPESLTMDADKNVTATFTAFPDFDYTWNFDTDGDAEGWVPKQSTVDVVSGILTITTSNNLPKIEQTGIGVPTSDYGVFEIKMKNNTPVTGASAAADVMRVNAVTSDGSNIFFNLDDESMGAGVITGNDANFKVYQVPLGDLGAYTGFVENYTFIGPRNQTVGSTVEIDYIKLIQKIDQTITFGALDPKNVGDPDIDLTATSDSGLPVSYASSDEAVVTISGSTITFVGAGTANITASQVGDAYYYPANDVVQSITVGKGDQTITFEALPAKTFGDAPFDLTATASSGQAITYTSLNESVATIAGSTVTIVGAGTTDITASQAGDANYNPAIDVVQTLTVGKADQTITFDALEDKVVGAADYDLTATASSGLAVSYASSDPTVATIAGATVTIVGAGTTNITASQAGDNNYNVAVDVIQILTVLSGKQDQTINFEALTDKAFGDPAFDLTATSDSDLPVSYTSSDETVATISGSTLTIVGVGITDITASQAGDDTFNAAPDVVQSLTVVKGDQVITFDALATANIGDQDFDLTASASSGLALTYTSSDPTVATVSGSTVTIVAVGSTEITASQPGDANYNPAVDVVQVLDVKQAQTITFEALPQKVVGDVPFDLTAVSSSGLAITYTSSDEAVATIAGSTVTIIGVGTTDITASQAGDATYSPAADVVQMLTVIVCDALDLSATTTDPSCFEAADGSIDLTVTGSSGSYTVSWSSGQDTEDLTDLAAGEYTATVTDDKGCVAMTTVTLNQPAALALTSASVTETIACNGETGTVTLLATGGTGDISYTFNGQTNTTGIFNGVSAGAGQAYSITDANGCGPLSGSIEVTQPEEMVITATIEHSTDVSGNGSIDVSIAGGTSPYSFVWDTGQETEDLSGLMAGIYTLTATDANLCSSSEVFEVSGVTAIEFDATTSLSFYPNPVKDRINIEYEAKSDIAQYTIFSLNGVIVKQGRISTKSTSIDCQDMQNGNYILSITDGSQRITQKLIKK